MRSVVIIEKKEIGGYYATASGIFGGGYSNAFAGKTPEDAACFASREVLRYCRTKEGGDLVAPPEIMAIVPKHLHSIEAR